MQLEKVPVSSAVTASFFESLEYRLLDCLKNRDVKALEKLVDDQCVGVGIGGREYTKTGFVQGLIEAVQIRDYVVTSVHSVIENGFSVVLSNYELDMSLNQAIIRGHVRVTRTWVEREAGWKLLSFHVADARLANSWDKTTKKKDFAD